MKKFFYNIITSIIIGIIVGLIIFIFATILLKVVNIQIKLFPYNIYFLPIVGLIIIYLTELNNKKCKNSMEQLFNSFSSKKKLSIIILPFQVITTWLSHLVGASVGREGVAVQLGGVIGQRIPNKSSFDHKFLTLLGMGAGFSALFGVWIAGLFFAFEMGKLSYKKYYYWGYLALVTIISKNIVVFLGLQHYKHIINFNYEFITIKTSIIFTISCLILISCGILFSISLKKFKVFLSQYNSYVVMLVGSLILMVIMYITTNHYSSLGLNLIDQAINNPKGINSFDVIMKFILTISFISIGFQGGEVTPLFTIGAILGARLAILFNLPSNLLIAIGYTLVFANATKAYYTSFFICIFIFGIQTLPFILFGIILSKLINYKTSIYPILI